MNTAQFVERMKMKQSVQQNTAYGAGALFRSGDMRQSGPRAITAGNAGGFSPLLLAPFIPIIHEIIKRPLNKLWDKIGFGQGGGALFRSGGFFNKAADCGMHTRPVHSGLHVPPHHSAKNAAFGGSTVPSTLDGKTKLSKYEKHNLQILEKKLGSLTGTPDMFVQKLAAIHAKGEAWFRKHRQAAKHKKGGKTKYKFSKRYRAAKAKHYAKHPKAQFGKYRKSDKYKKHKAKYVDHRKKKACC